MRQIDYGATISQTGLAFVWIVRNHIRLHRAYLNEGFTQVTVTELVAIHWYNRGNDLRASGDLAGAERSYVRAARVPRLRRGPRQPGAVQQLRGAFAKTGMSYGEAVRAWPDLPGLGAPQTPARRCERAVSAPCSGYLPPAASALRQK